MRRSILLYLFGITIPALVLLYLGLQSVERQQQAIAGLAESNRLLAAEKLADRLQKRSRDLALACLQHSESGCEIATHFFTFSGGRLISPRVRSLTHSNPALLPPAFHQAEILEIQQHRVEEALTAYRAVHLSAVPASLKALTLNRMARCLDKLQRKSEAQSAWRQLLREYGILYDPAGRPYSLTARFELGLTEGIYEELIQYRWDLSAELFDFYLNRLNRAPPAGNRFEFARELEEHFQPAALLREGEIYSFALPQSRVLYRAEKPGLIHGLSVNSTWVQNTLIPALRRELNLPEVATPQSNRDLWIYGGTTAFVLAIMLLGVVFVIRDARREVRMSRLRADFVSGVSHELKTPLTLIRLYGETLLHGSDFPESERRGFCEIITRESERLSLLVQKVLSFSSIDRGDKVYSLQTGDLAAVIASIVEVYRKYLERAGFEVDARLIDELPEMRFDAGAVSQAVVNLLENAVKYSGDSKYIGIRLHADAGNAVFEVEDRGIGIPPAERGKIFQRFYRSPNGAGKGGYGLGLFLVRHIMDAHLGRVEVESEPGVGSLFRLIFPVTA